MALIYAFLISLFIAIGASCSGDVVRLQQLISTGYNLDFFEPFSAFTIKVLNIFFINQSSAILHFLAIFLIIFSFRLYFLSTALISKKNFYFISFIFIFNPLTLLLVTNNTRQLFFTSLLSFPFNYFVSNIISRNFKNEYSIKREKILRNKLIPFILLILSFGTHSSFPLIFIFSGILFFVYNVLKISYTRNIYLRIKNSINLKNFISFCFFTPLLLFTFYSISGRIIYVLRVYGPFIDPERVVGRNMYFDTGSPSLIFSALINLSLFFYLGFKIPKKYLLLKSFMFSAFLGLVLPFIMASIFPLFIGLFARIYLPIALLNLPFALVLLKEYIRTKFINFIIIIFTISSLSLQTQKYLNYEGKSTFFSLGNEEKYSCSLVPFRRN